MGSSERPRLAADCMDMDGTEPPLSSSNQRLITQQIDKDLLKKKSVSIADDGARGKGPVDRAHRALVPACSAGTTGHEGLLVSSGWEPVREGGGGVPKEEGPGRTRPARTEAPRRAALTRAGL